MKICLVALIAWLAGLAALVVGAAAVLEGIPTRWLGVVAAMTFGASAVTSLILLAPAMFIARARTANRSLRFYAVLGTVLGLLPGLYFAWFAGALRYIDAGPRTIAQMVTSPDGIVTLGATAVSGAVFGAAFFKAFVRRQP